MLTVSKLIFSPLLAHLSICIYFNQIPTSAVAISVYTYLEAFAKLEKRLSEGQEGSSATRGQPTIHDIRSKLDKFIKALGPSEIQVCDCMCAAYQHFVFCLLSCSMKLLVIYVSIYVTL